MILIECYSMALSMVSESMLLGVPDDRGSCNSSNIFLTICLLYCDQQHLHLLHNKFFWLLLQFEFVKHKFPNKITFHIHLHGFQIIHIIRQCMCQYTSYHDTINHSQYLHYLDCFSHMIYMCVCVCVCVCVCAKN